MTRSVLAQTDSICWLAGEPDGFLFAPLPYTLHQRDTSAWVHQQVLINSMILPARRRESVNTRAVYRFHPMYAGTAFAGADDEPSSATTAFPEVTS